MQICLVINVETHKYMKTWAISIPLPLFFDHPKGVKYGKIRILAV